MAYLAIFRVFRDAVQTEKYSLSDKIELLEVPHTTLRSILTRIPRFNLGNIGKNCEVPNT